MESFSSSKTQSWLSWFLRGLLFLGFLVLLGRLIDLQIIKGAYFRSLAEENRIRRVPIVAARGKILARGGEVLVGNREVKRAVFFDPESGYKKLDDLTQASEDEIITEWIRDYKLGPDFAHVSGYLGEVGRQEVGKIKGRCPEKGPARIGSWVGRTGLEEAYECELSGIDGEELVEVDARGDRVRTLGRRDPIPGSDIITTIHYGLQKKIAEIMRGSDVIPSGRRGAVVVIDNRGEVLALYSSPSFDPNVFVERDDKKITLVLENYDTPLFNRAIGGSFHPGSVVKPVVAVSALEEGKIDEKFVYDDPGVITIDTIYGKFSYSNWYFTQYGRREGKIGLVTAITRSTDTFFYKLGELIGIEKLVEWFHKFEMDKPTGIDLPGESAGLVPSPEWKMREKGERWFLGNTYHMSIGQGDIALTPLGVNTAISAIAAGGVYCTPHLVVETGSGKFQFPFSNLRCKNLEISEKTIELVKEGMKGACSPGGTGFTFFDFTEKTGIDVACKTGTAETNEEGKTHAWFTAFAPYDFPEIVATVLVEKGGEGAYVAGPIAREIFDYWFLEKN